MGRALQLGHREPLNVLFPSSEGIKLLHFLHSIKKNQSLGPRKLL